MHYLKKYLGQNFLVNDGIKQLMVDSLEVADNDIVVEIGAGSGAITKLLASLEYKNTKFLIIEYDARFIPELKVISGKNNNFEIINVDILDWLPKYKSNQSLKIIGSLPYYITSPILHSIIKSSLNISSCVLLVQKEVARKIVKKEPNHSYLSCFLQTFCDIKIIANVSKGSFRPIPKVDSCVIKLSKKQKQSIDQQSIYKYEKFLHRAFANPRKMLNKVFSKDILDIAGIDSTLRPQNINLEKWIKLFDFLKNTS